MTGTTVAAFEPALDYVVVKLPRFPFDKFPTADRRLGSQMKATGEVMAIDRTFGAALNKALRGLEQAGAGPLAEDPAGRPTLDYLAGGLRAATRRATTRRSAGIDEAGPGVRVDALRAALRGADRAAAVPRAVRLAAVAGARAAPAGRPGGGVQRATGIAAWFLAEMGRNVALEADVRGDRPAARPTPDDAEAASCSPRPSGPASATGTWRLSPA